MDNLLDTILICDTDNKESQILRKFLADMGYMCQVVKNIHDAMISMKILKVDLLLLNINFTEEIKDCIDNIKNINPNMYIIVVADDDNERDIAIDYVNYGAYDYLVKPFNKNESLHKIRRIIEREKLLADALKRENYFKKKIKDQERNIQEAFIGSVSALSFALESKDRYTAGHSRRVAAISVAIGEKLNMPEKDLEVLRWGGLLHDLAKIAIDEKVLNKKGKLDSKEYEYIMTHPLIGACLTQSIVTKREIIDIIQYHHYHYNGDGFRQNLRGQEIPLMARIVSLADAYDAMTSERPYRGALSRDEAIKIIKEQSFRQFDPIMVEAFLQLSNSDLFPKRQTILICDDEESIRLLVRSILGNDYEIIEAANGEEATKIVYDVNPSLVLMDIMMPKKDGFDACFEIKSKDSTKMIPVIILSAIDKQMDKKLAQNLGADGYVVKPFSPQELSNVIKKYLT